MAANPISYAIGNIQKKAQQLFSPVGQAISRVPQQFGNYLQQSYNNSAPVQGLKIYQGMARSPQVQNMVRQAPSVAQNFYQKQVVSPQGWLNPTSNLKSMAGQDFAPKGQFEKLPIRQQVGYAAANLMNAGIPSGSTVPTFKFNPTGAIYGTAAGAGIEALTQDKPTLKSSLLSPNALLGGVLGGIHGDPVLEKIDPIKSKAVQVANVGADVKASNRYIKPFYNAFDSLKQNSSVENPAWNKMLEFAKRELSPQELKRYNNLKSSEKMSYLSRIEQRFGNEIKGLRQEQGLQTAESSIKLPVEPQLKVVNGKVKVKMKPVKGSDTFAAEMEKIRLQNQPVQPRPQPQEFSQAEAGQMGGMSEANAQFDQKGLKGLLDKWVGKKNSSRTTGAVEGSKYMNIPKEQTGDVIKSLEGSKTNATASTVKGIRAKFDALYNQAKKDGIDIGYRENYVPHYWSAPEDQVRQMYQVFKQREGFQNRRLIPTYEEGLKMGLTPRFNNPAQIIEQYVSKMEQLKNNIDLFKSLKNQGFIVPASVGRQKGFVPIDAYGFPKSNSVVGEGKVIIGDYYAPVEVANMLRKVFNPQTDSGIIGSIADKTAKASGVLQDVGLSGGIPGTPLNAFGTMQTLKDVMGGNFSAVKNFFRSVSPQATEKKILSQAGTIAKMQERNIPVRSPDLSELIDGAIVNRTVGEKVGGKWNRLVNDPTFKRMMTQNQIDFFEKIEKAALKGGKNSQEAADIAGAAVKQFYGTTNTGTTALQSKIGKDVTRTFLFAPKFREAMVNFWVNNIKALKNPTALQNRGNAIFMGSAIVMAGAMDYLNRQLNGHGMLENPKGNEDKLLIPVGKITGDPNDQTVIGIPFLSSIATIPRALFRELLMLGQGDIAGAGRDAFQSYASMLVKPAADVIANQDYFGKEIVKDTDTTGDKFTKQGKYLATQYLGHPYLKEAFDTRNQDDPLYQRVSRALELPFRFKTTDSLTKSDFYDEYYKLKPYGDEFESLKYKDPQAAQEFINKNADKLNRLAELKTRQNAYYDSGAQANPQAISLLDTKTKLQDVQYGGVDLEKEKFRQSGKKSAFINGKLYYYDDQGDLSSIDTTNRTTGNAIKDAKRQSEIQSAISKVYLSNASEQDKNLAYKSFGTTPQDAEFKALASLDDSSQASVLYNLLKDRQWKQEKVDAFIKSDVLTNNVVTKMESQGLINSDQATQLKAYIKNMNVKFGKVAPSKGKKPKKLKIPKLKAIKMPKSKLKLKIVKPKKYKSLLSKGSKNKYFT